MAKVNIRTRPETETLYLDFFFRGTRCREQTALSDTPEHRKRLQALANRIQKEIERGTFDYGAFFPNSPKVEVFAHGGPTDAGPQADEASAPSPMQTTASDRQTPSFADFAELWFLELSPQWRRMYRQTIRETLDTVLLPAFGTGDTAILQAGARRQRHVIDGGGEALLVRLSPRAPA